MTRQFVTQSKLKTQYFSPINQHLLIESKSHRKNLNGFDTKQHSFTSSKQNWKSYIHPQINEKYSRIQKSKVNIIETPKKLRTQQYLKSSSSELNNPQHHNQSETKLSNKIQNKHKTHKRLATCSFIAISEDIQQEENKKINYQDRQEIIKYKEFLLKENQKFLKRQIGELSKLLHQKYSKQQKNYQSKQQMNNFRKKYLNDYDNSHCQYLIEQVGYLRQKFLDHYERYPLHK